MENKKKQTMYIAVIVIGFAASAWLIFTQLGGGGAGGDVALPEVFDVESGQLPGSEIPTGQIPASSITLPYGPEIDVSILSNAEFLRLVPAPELTVTPEELGKTHPFQPGF